MTALNRHRGRFEADPAFMAPEPSRISKASCHGCIRLTNWDAEELAQMVKPGTLVRFVD
jgi:lipoprotein-anchoring transpeptidase ErfK/SrfK